MSEQHATIEKVEKVLAYAKAIGLNAELAGWVRDDDGLPTEPADSVQELAEHALDGSDGKVHMDIGMYLHVSINAKQIYDEQKDEYRVDATSDE